MGSAKQTIDEKKLSHWKLLDEFRRRLAKVMEAAEPKQKPPGGPERLLLERDYFSLMLFGLFNPVVDSKFWVGPHFLTLNQGPNGGDRSS